MLNKRILLLIKNHKQWTNEYDIFIYLGNKYKEYSFVQYVQGVDPDWNNVHVDMPSIYAA